MDGVRWGVHVFACIEYSLSKELGSVPPFSTSRRYGSEPFSNTGDRQPQQTPFRHNWETSFQVVPDL